MDQLFSVYDDSRLTRRNWLAAATGLFCASMASPGPLANPSDDVPRTQSEFGTLELPNFEAVPLKGLRDWLLVMDRDADGVIWAGTTKGNFLSYDPASRKHTLHDVPGTGAINACLCVGEKVYLLGREYPKLRVFERTTKTWNEFDYPTADVNFWYGCRVVDDHHLALFNYGGRGDTVVWDCQSDSGEVIRYPFEGPPPGIGYLAEEGKAAYSLIFEYFEEAASKYRLVKWSRLDLAEKKWTDEYEIPITADDVQPIRAGETAGETLWHPHLSDGKMLGFDTKHRRWTHRLDIPGYREIFYFSSSGNGLGSCGSGYRGLRYYSMSTFSGDDDKGIDGHPPHYLNGLLVFDPASKRFDILRLKTGEAYHQTGFTLPANDRLHFHSTNLKRPDGSFGKGLNDAEGEVYFWQPA